MSRLIYEPLLFIYLSVNEFLFTDMPFGFRRHRADEIFEISLEVRKFGLRCLDRLSGVADARNALAEKLLPQMSERFISACL